MRLEAPENYNTLKFNMDVHPYEVKCVRCVRTSLKTRTGCVSN